MNRFFATAAVLILAACGSSGGPEIYRAPDVSIEGAQTFRWAADAEAGAREKQAREVAAVVRQEVVSAMQERGLRQVASGGDLVVRHELIVEMRSVVVGGSSPAPMASADAPFNDGRDVDMPESAVGGQDEQRMEVPAGTLLITVSNSQGQIVWRAWDDSAVDMLAIAQPELTSKVRAIIAQFP